MASAFKDITLGNSRWATFPVANTKFETQIKASVSELNRGMQNNEMGSLETLDDRKTKISVNSYFVW